jgi:glycosyltransferase involved in cell wall biosynthesis
MDKLSVIIPARNEEFLQKTIESVLAAAEEDIEVIAICDGYWPAPPIKDDTRVILIHHTEAIGQRQAINEGARIANGKYVMKLDAHCNVAKGFDKILKEDCLYEWTMVPRMYNLDILTWEPKLKKKTDYMFISAPTEEKPFRAQYYNSGRPKSDKLIDETMCCMGPGWFMHKDRFWELGGCDENHGGWGQQGVEVSLKAWLSGGALMVNKRTWFAHWFRGGGVPEGFKSGFPYSISGRAVERARSYSRDLWLNNKWEKQTRTIEWLIEKFRPPTWGVGESVPDLSIIIPSYKDPLLHKTISGILENFETDYEIIPVLDGYDPIEPLPVDSRIRPIRLPQNVGMRGAINAGVKAARGKYIMRSDEHCIFCTGFDRIILADIKDNEIVTAKRYFLDPVKWEIIKEREPVVYEQLVIKETPRKLSAVSWPSRDAARADIMIDETMAMQGSAWVMPRLWWSKVIGELQTEGYGPHYQDTMEMLFKTWEAGGKLMINKNAWYAHKHRQFNRTHQYAVERAIPEWLYSLNKWYPAYVEMKRDWKTRG